MSPLNFKKKYDKVQKYLHNFNERIFNSQFFIDLYEELCYNFDDSLINLMSYNELVGSTRYRLSNLLEIVDRTAYHIEYKFLVDILEQLK